MRRSVSCLLLRLSFSSLLLVASASIARAEIVVIANSDLPVTVLSAEVVADFYLGKAFKTPNGLRLIPLERGRGSRIRQQFHQEITKKTPAQLNAYWSRRVFTGAGFPPDEVEDADELVRLVSHKLNFIAYAEREEVKDSLRSNALKVLLVLK